jgi:hypothetical protein
MKIMMIRIISSVSMTNLAYVVRYPKGFTSISKPITGHDPEPVPSPPISLVFQVIICMHSLSPQLKPVVY